MKTILVDALHSLAIKTENGSEIDQTMFDILESFPNPKIILTNANEGESKQFGFDKLPYEIFSLAHNPDKTDPKYYETMLAHFGISIDDVIYFEHTPEAVESAKSVGIKTLFFDCKKRDLGELKEFLNSNLS